MGEGEINQTGWGLKNPPKRKECGVDHYLCPGDKNCNFLSGEGGSRKVQREVIKTV